MLYQGTFERAISLFRTAYSFVTLSRDYYPKQLTAVWFSPSVPHASFYTPLYPFSDSLPHPLTVGSLYYLSHDSVWWAAQSINNYMTTMFSYMVPDVQAAQSQVQKRADDDAIRIEKKAADLLASGQSDEARALLTRYQNDNANAASASWWQLFDYLLGRFHDGQRVDCTHAETYAPTSLFYPFEWLASVGFWKNMPNGQPDLSESKWAYTRPMPNRPHAPSSGLHSTDLFSNKVAVSAEAASIAPAVTATQVHPVSSTSLADARIAADETGWAVHLSLLGWIVSFALFAGIFTLTGMLLERQLAKHRRGYMPINQADL